MDRKTFIKQLKSKLWMRSSRAEIKKVVADYNKFFDESENIDEAIKSCGDINLIVDELISPLPVIKYIKLRVFLLFAMLPFLYSYFFNVYLVSSFSINFMHLFLCAVLFIQMLIVGESTFKGIEFTSASQKNTYKKVLLLFSIVIGIIGLFLVITSIIALVTPLPANVDANTNTDLPIYYFFDTLIYGSNFLLVMSTVLAMFAFRLGKKIIPLMVANMAFINLFVGVDIATQIQAITSNGLRFMFAVFTDVIIYMIIFFIEIAILFALYKLYGIIYRRVTNGSAT